MCVPVAMKPKKQKTEFTKEDELENKMPDISEQFLTRIKANSKSENDRCDVTNCFCNPLKISVPTPENEIYDNHANLMKQFAALEAELEQAKSCQNDLDKVIENSEVLEEKVANLEAELKQARTGQNDLKIAKGHLIL